MVSIVNNASANLAAAFVNAADAAVFKSASKLASGNKIVTAADDAAGSAIGNNLKSSVTNAKTALSTTAQALALLNIAGGALNEIISITQRLQELAAQAQSDTTGSAEKGFLNQEFQELVAQINSIATNTDFNGVKLLDGSQGANSSLSSLSTGVTFTDTGTLGNTVLAGQVFTVADAAGAADLTLIGSLADAVVGINAQANNIIDVFLTINGQIYNATSVTIANAIESFVLTNEITGTTIAFNLSAASANTIFSAIGVTAAQVAANALVAGIEADLADITVYQTKTLVPVGVVNDTILAGINADNDDFTLTSTGFNLVNGNAPAFSAFTVTAETATTDGKVSVFIGGSLYSTVDGAFDGIGTAIDVNAFTLTSADDANSILTINLADALAASIGIDTTSEAEALEVALNQLFGVGADGGLSFKTGAAANDVINVVIAGASSADLFYDDAGTSTLLDITTTAGAETATEVLANALATILGITAGIGASQNRIGFAANALETSIQNLEAANAVITAVDVATESTQFAKSQVQLQAAISVLAQANLLPQNLLKLIG